jgi:mono/diheme cytochrome c family protein
MRGGTIAFLTGVAALGVAIIAAPAEPPAMPAAAARGEHLYNTGTCRWCHGINGVYPVGPSLIGPPLIGPTFKYGGDPMSLARSIREGNPLWMGPKGGMNLTEDQIGDIVAYLKYREQTASPEERALAVSRLPSGVPKSIVHSAVEDFRVETVAKLYYPYSFDFLPDGRILVSETDGPLRIIDHGKLLTNPVEGAPRGDTTGNTSLIHRANMSVAVHPNFKVNGWVYLLTTRHATHPLSSTAPEIATIWRGRLVGNRWLDNRKILEYPLEGTDSDRLKFDKQGYLYVGTVGTHGGYTGAEDPKRPPQDLSSPEGKILRMKDDGSVPPDNPSSIPPAHILTSGATAIANPRA